MSDTLPCSECGHNVEPGNHPVAECQANQAVRSEGHALAREDKREAEDEPILRGGGPARATPRPLRWDESDLDRCKHGRHSIDHCLDCGGPSTGNLFLMRPHASASHRERVRTFENGRTEVRIGTAVGGQPIWVAARREAR